MADNTQPYQKPPGGYGKKPLWQWILIYLVVGGLLYFLIYWFFIRSAGGY